MYLCIHIYLWINESRRSYERVTSHAASAMGSTDAVTQRCLRLLSIAHPSEFSIKPTGMSSTGRDSEFPASVGSSPFAGWAEGARKLSGSDAATLLRRWVWVMAHVWWGMSHTWMRQGEHISASWWTMYVSCHTCEWVGSYVWMGHGCVAALQVGLSHGSHRRSHVAHVNESWQTYAGVMAHTCVASHTYCNTHTATHTLQHTLQLLRTFAGVMAHASHHTYECVVSHIWMRRDSCMKTWCHT